MKQLILITFFMSFTALLQAQNLDIKSNSVTDTKVKQTESELLRRSDDSIMSTRNSSKDINSIVYKINNHPLYKAKKLAFIENNPNPTVDERREFIEDFIANHQLN